jgi:alkylation response protein AidB-like acyl-CoA dehydrogenase
MPTGTVYGVESTLLEAGQARERWGELIRELVNPGAAERYRAGSPIPNEVFRQSAQQGLLAYSLPTELGGAGADAFEWGLVLEELGYLCEDGSFPFFLGLRATVAATLYESNRPDIVDRYARPMALGERFGSFAFSDGTDPFSFRTIACQARDGSYVLDGEKQFTTGGLTADCYLVYAQEERTGDILVFIVERDDAGVTLGPLDLHGYRTAGLCALRLDDVRVPAERVLVAADGLSHAQNFLNRRRILLCCGPVGRMRAMWEACVNHLHSTIRYGRPLTDMQATQAAIGRMTASVQACRAVLHTALARQGAEDSDPLWDPAVTAAKYFITEQVNAFCADLFRLTGGFGYRADTGFGAFQRDVAALFSGGGAQGTLEVDLGIMAIERVTRGTP